MLPVVFVVAARAPAGSKAVPDTGQLIEGAVLVPIGLTLFARGSLATTPTGLGVRLGP